jgi:2'-5' RNA ligase
VAAFRLFVAVDVSAEVRRALDEALRPLRELAPGARWTAPEKWHLTLQFLGGVDAQRLGELAQGLGQAALASHPFALQLSGAGTFGRPGHDTVLWAGAAEGALPLERLARGVGAVLAPLGFPPEARPFAPHLTLARAQDGRRGDPHLAAVAAALRGWKGPTCTVDRLVLYESTPAGAYLSRLAARLPSWRFVPHTAEVKVELEADSEAGLFSAATGAFAELLSGAPGVAGRSVDREVEVHGADPVARWVAFWDELVFLSETVPGIPRRCRVTSLGPEGMRAVVEVAVDAPLETPVKAATLHDANFTPGADGPWRAAVVLDV